MRSDPPTRAAIKPTEVLPTESLQVIVRSDAEKAHRRKRLHFASAQGAIALACLARALYLLPNGEILAWLAGAFGFGLYAYLTWKIG